MSDEMVKRYPIYGSLKVRMNKISIKVSSLHVLEAAADRKIETPLDVVVADSTSQDNIDDSSIIKIAVEDLVSLLGLKVGFTAVGSLSNLVLMVLVDKSCFSEGFGLTKNIFVNEVRCVCVCICC